MNKMSNQDLSPRILVMLCTYNERQNVELLIPEILKFVPEASILVIDDNSPDGTGVYVDQLAQQNPQIHVLHRPAKAGLGTATVAGFQWAIDQQFDVLINMDADFSHPPRFIPSILAKMDENDVVIGSRYVEGGAVVGWGMKRHLMSRGINLYARAMLGLETYDNSGSFRGYRVKTLGKVDWTGVRAKGYAIQEEILYRLKRDGAQMAEVPITFEERRFGETKITWKEAVDAGWVLMQLRLNNSSHSASSDPG